MLASPSYRFDGSRTGDIQGALNPIRMGEVMPAFSFEKISQRARRSQPSASSPSPEKQRGIIHQLVDRLTEARARRGADKTRSVATRINAKSADK
jgi:hypothetical protein